MDDRGRHDLEDHWKSQGSRRLQRLFDRATRTRRDSRDAVGLQQRKRVELAQTQTPGAPRTIQHLLRSRPIHIIEGPDLTGRPFQPAAIAVHRGERTRRRFREDVSRDAGRMKQRPALRQSLPAHQHGQRRLLAADGDISYGAGHILRLHTQWRDERRDDGIHSGVVQHRFQRGPITVSASAGDHVHGIVDRGFLGQGLSQPFAGALRELNYLQVV